MLALKLPHNVWHLITTVLKLASLEACRKGIYIVGISTSFHMITAHDLLFHRHSYCNLKDTTVWGFHYMLLCKMGIRDKIVVGLLAFTSMLISK